MKQEKFQNYQDERGDFLRSSAQTYLNPDNNKSRNQVPSIVNIEDVKEALDRQTMINDGLISEVGPKN